MKIIKGIVSGRMMYGVVSTANRELCFDYWLFHSVGEAVQNIVKHKGNYKNVGEVVAQETHTIVEFNDYTELVDDYPEYFV